MSYSVLTGRGNKPMVNLTGPPFDFLLLFDDGAKGLSGIWVCALVVIEVALTVGMLEVRWRRAASCLPALPPSTCSRKREEVLLKAATGG